MDRPIFRLPPYMVTRVFLASEIQDRIDWGQKAQRLPEAWKRTKGEGVKVAVLDTGLDRQHAETGDLAGAVEAAEDFTNSRQGWHDGRADGHGTHVAGIIGARENNRGVIGFAPQCRLLVGKCMVRSSGEGQWIADALDWAAQQGAHVISLSLGSPDQDFGIAAALERAVISGAIVCAAAGNDGLPNAVNFPARWKQPHGRPNLDCLAVAAIGEDGKLAAYSSRGPEVDLAAPGSNVTSTFLNGGYATLSGTSMATPAVAGMIALLLSSRMNGGQPPRINHDDLRDLIRINAQDIGPPGRDEGSGWGIVADIGKLLAAPLAPPPTDEPVQSWDFGVVQVHVPAQVGDRLGLNWKS